MAIRDTLKANLDVALTGSNVSVSAELPFTTGGEALYIKNMKKLYLDQDNIDKSILFTSLDLILQLHQLQINVLQLVIIHTFHVVLLIFWRLHLY